MGPNPCVHGSIVPSPHPRSMEWSMPLGGTIMTAQASLQPTLGTPQEQVLKSWHARMVAYRYLHGLVRISFPADMTTMVTLQSVPYIIMRILLVSMAPSLQWCFGKASIWATRT